MGGATNSGFLGAMLLPGQAATHYNSIAEAAQMQLVDVVTEMIEAGYDLNVQDIEGNTGLHWAAFLGLESLAKELLDVGARQDVLNNRGESPAHMAAKSCNVALLAILLSAKRDILSARDADGFTPFLACTQENGAPVLEWLYLRGASFEARDHHGRTPLMWACYKGHRRTVQWLLSRSACVAARDHEGMTALHWAAVRDQGPIAEMLLEVGAVSVFAPDGSGDTPLSLARKKHNWGLAFAFVKAILFQRLLGRSSLTKNGLASVFALLAVYNSIVFVVIVAPRIWSTSPVLTAVWPCLFICALCMWFRAMCSDPGWPHPKTVLSQSARIQEQETEGLLELWRKPLEEQMAAAIRMDNLLTKALEDEEEVKEGRPNSRVVGGPWNTLRTTPDRRLSAKSSRDRLARLEAQQLRIAQQQQLIEVIRRSLARQRATRHTTLQSAPDGELQPLMSPVEPELMDKLAERGVAVDVSVDDFPPEAKLPPIAPLRAAAAGKCLGTVAALLDFTPGEGRTAEQELGHLAKHLPEVARRTAEQLSKERLSELCRLGGAEYARAVQEGDFRHVCVICHRTRTLRVQHCKECGRCVQRLDHHCPWIDNCVGLRNQRLFYCFLLVVFTTLAMVLSFLMLFMFQAHSGFRPLWGVVGLGDDLVVLATSCLDCIWVFFVGSLLVRQSAYMVANVTTYEVLLSPPHVQNRFPKRSRRFWYLSGITLRSGLRSCLGYWRADTSGDAYDFGVAESLEDAPYSGFVALEDRERALLGRQWACAEFCGSEFAPVEGYSVGKGEYSAYVPGKLEADSFPRMSGGGKGGVPCGTPEQTVRQLGRRRMEEAKGVEGAQCTSGARSRELMRPPGWAAQRRSPDAVEDGLECATPKSPGLDAAARMEGL